MKDSRNQGSTTGEKAIKMKKDTTRVNPLRQS